MFTALLLLLLLNGYPYTLTGMAVKIKDGDTFVLLTGKQETFTIRLEGIDAPEKGQDFYKASKNMLCRLLQQNPLTVKVISKDRYGRLIARVNAGDHGDINFAMIRCGMAWHFKKYSSEVLLADAEIFAKTHKTGLWKMQYPIPPWEFRQQKKPTPAKQASGKQVSQVFFCKRPHQSVIISHKGIRQRPLALL
ncbi:thermonuclease family protein [Flavihumibacter petaseus]|uniref:TNase-like domain-containing protein n=1 Tax=Flavihumibacter petaseus NBRC 106054 TaxID=1220578 RepID=A0A0E9MZC0_9BACT|nr:thermonuclease family protein [Flavihumibacter petaseus]GAO42445.1 hypothetical protein FPE01S_01_14600 [Flavihumibacter petaseus NBRC 106054]